MKYEVRMNGTYMNRFATYTEAADFREYLERMFKKGKVEIIALWSDNFFISFHFNFLFILFLIF